MRIVVAICVAAAIGLWIAYPRAPAAAPETFGQYAKRVCAVEEPNDQAACYSRKVNAKAFSNFQRDYRARVRAEETR